MEKPKQQRNQDTGKLITEFLAKGPLPSPGARTFSPAERKVALDEAPSHLLKDCAAVFVAHGMGQQIPFQTLDDVVFGLRQEDRRQRDRLYKQQKLATPGAPPPTTSTIQHGDERLQRVEMSVCDDAGQEREVHLYEGYWAPLVEGKVTVRDVLVFSCGQA